MVCRGLFVVMGENNEVYTVEQFKRVKTFLSFWLEGPGSPDYPVLPPLEKDNYMVVPLISTFDELIGYLGPDAPNRTPGEMCK